MAPGFSRFSEDFALPATLNQHDEKSAEQLKNRKFETGQSFRVGRDELARANQRRLESHIETLHTGVKQCGDRRTANNPIQ